MKVCFLHAGRTQHGGIGRAVSVVANGLARYSDVHIVVLSLFPEDSESLYPLEERICQKHLFETRMTMRKVIMGHGISRLSSYIREMQIDVIIGCGALYYPLAVAAARCCHIRSICWEHTNPETSKDYRFQGIARALGMKLSSQNVLITKAAKEYYDKHCSKSKNIVIYNPADDELFANKPNYAVDSKKIISVGRLSYPKNYPLLIRVAKQILMKYPDWSWDIYGDGEERAELMKQIQTEKLEGKLRLMGAVSDIYRRYGDYSMIVMTSRYEGFPMVLIEAAACGLPMISFDIKTGPKEIIDQGNNGFLVAAEDESEMVNAIVSMITDSQFRTKCSRNAINTAKMFSLCDIVKQWIIVLRGNNDD